MEEKRHERENTGERNKRNEGKEDRKDKIKENKEIGNRRDIKLKKQEKRGR